MNVNVRHINALLCGTKVNLEEQFMAVGVEDQRQHRGRVEGGLRLFSVHCTAGFKME